MASSWRHVCSNLYAAQQTIAHLRNTVNAQRQDLETLQEWINAQINNEGPYAT